MPANLENSAVATGLEKVSFHSNPKETKCQRMLKTTTQLHSSHIAFISHASPGVGNDDLLQYSCLENPVDREAWWTTVHGVTKSRTWLSDWTHTHTHKVCSNFSKPGFSSTWTMNFQMFKLDLEKAEEPEINLPTSTGSLKEQESSRKTSASLTRPKPLTDWITTNCWKFFKRWEYQTTWSASWEICMQVKKHQLELDTEQKTGSKSGKEYVKAVYCHPAC